MMVSVWLRAMIVVENAAMVIGGVLWPECYNYLLQGRHCGWWLLRIVVSSAWQHTVMSNHLITKTLSFTMMSWMANDSMIHTAAFCARNVESQGGHGS